jgi:hypothetical protein
VPAAYSYDLRERLVAAVDEGISCRCAARQFKLGISTVIRWVARLATTGSCAAIPSGGDHKSKAVEALMTPLIFNWHITMAGSAMTPRAWLIVPDWPRHFRA